MEHNSPHFKPEENLANSLSLGMDFYILIVRFQEEKKNTQKDGLDKNICCMACLAHLK